MYLSGNFMTEKAEQKKKIYKISTELNIGSDEIIEFLRKKGHEVKSHMSTVDSEMLAKIMNHFRKDKDLADKHQKKLLEIKERKKKAEKVEVTEVDEKVDQSKPVRGKPVGQLRKEAEQTVVEIPQATVESTLAGGPGTEDGLVVLPTEETGKKPEQLRRTELPKVQPTAVEIPGGEIGEVGFAEARQVGLEEEKGKTDVLKGEGALEDVDKAVVKHKPPVGLRIKGKIDLARLRKKAGLDGGNKVLEAEATLIQTTSDKKKKKKKKKIREEARSKHVKQVETIEIGQKRKKKKLKPHELDEREVEDAIKRTFAEMDESGLSSRALFKRRKRKERLEEHQKALDQIEKEKTRLRVTEFVSVSELANLMNADVNDVIKKCIELGLLVSINQRLDKDTITLVADEFGYQVEFHKETADDVLQDFEDKESDLQSRAPIVTIMGHVDHGKTSLLDYIRNSNIVAGESGGITQHIGAYEVLLDGGRQIVFLDTPGHEAFTAMRARGAQVTDIVVLVVAADDSVMPQTIEAISHAQAASVPIIIAINKTDKPDAKPDRIRQQLSERGILVEDWGGKYQCVEISAKTGKNVDDLLEKILLEAEILELTANPRRAARGTVIEVKLDKGKGIVATVLVRKGTLRIGDAFIAGIHSGRVRAMMDERDNRVEAAKPSTPVQVLGFDGIPQAGDEFIAMHSDRDAREISSRRQQLKREQDFRQVKLVTLDEISEQIQQGAVKTLNMVVKGDVDGSVEALADSLMKLPNKEVKVNVIHRGVGAISESDVLLASASNAVIIGFHVRPNLSARKLAERDKVDIRFYNIIYDAISEVRDALEGMLNPEVNEEVTATVEVRDTFKVPKAGTVAGCHVQDGKLVRNNKVRLVRDGIVMFDGSISSLKRFKDDVREVDAGFECGVGLENFNDVKVGDIIEAYKVVERKRKL
jgi:translation initiation factor IF-2